MKDKGQIKTINRRMKEILAEEQTFVLAFSAKDKESSSQYDALISAEMSTKNMVRGIANALFSLTKNDKILRMAIMAGLFAKMMGEDKE